VDTPFRHSVIEVPSQTSTGPVGQQFLSWPIPIASRQGRTKDTFEDGQVGWENQVANGDVRGAYR
jgi:hypothetical protein